MQATVPAHIDLNLSAMRSALGLSRERMARLFDVSAKTIERWERRGDGPPPTADRKRLLQIREIIDLGRVVYTDEGLHLFLTSPMPVFGGSTALELIERGEGDSVYSALVKDYEGPGS
jgi:transcriptional regulator with XRE-family HTH domain